MKRQILILGAALTLTSGLQAQEIPQDQVPSVVLNEFNKQFSEATDTEWELEGTVYNVEFEVGWNTDHELWYDQQGKMLKHKEDIATSELPEAVRKKVDKDFSGYSIDDLERITEDDKVVYKMELNAFTKQDYDLLIDAEGNVLSKMAD